MESLSDVLKCYFKCCYVCNACGKRCAFVVTNDFNSLPKPKCCPYNIPGSNEYNEDIIPNWKKSEFFSTGKASSLEREKKFLVKDDGWKKLAVESEEIRQGYFESKGARIRVRISEKSNKKKAFLTIKSVGNISNGVLVRDEYEYEISCADGEAMLKTFCGKRELVKKRSTVIWHNNVWYVDEYALPYPNFAVAEIELNSVSEEIETPHWVGEPIKVDSYSLALLNEQLIIKA